MKKVFYFLLVTAIISSCMPEKPSDNKAEMNKARIREFYDQLVNAHNADMVDSFIVSDFVDHQFDPDNSKMSSETVKAGFKEFFTSYPDAHLRINFMIASGDTVMANVTMTGTNSGPLMGKPATNKSINIDGIAVFVLNGNKISQRWRFFNDVLMREQLGISGMADTTEMSSKK